MEPICRILTHALRIYIKMYLNVKPIGLELFYDIIYGVDINKSFLPIRVELPT